MKQYIEITREETVEITRRSQLLLIEESKIKHLIDGRVRNEVEYELNDIIESEDEAMAGAGGTKARVAAQIDTLLILSLVFPHLINQNQYCIIRDGI